MDIRLNSLYQNKTLKYLVPSFNKAFGLTFSEKFNSVFKLAVGLHDCLLDGTPYENQRLIFILLDKAVKVPVFKSFIDYVKHQEYYVMDYAYDDVLYGRQHMLVIKYPESMQDVYDRFNEGKYSQMYDFEEVEKFFKTETEAKGVIIKSTRAMNLFRMRVNEDFNFQLDNKDLLVPGTEYEYELLAKEEYFNYRGEQ